MQSMIFIYIITTVFLLYLLFKLFTKYRHFKKESKETQDKYKDIINVEDEVNNKQLELNTLKEKYLKANEVYDRLSEENKLYQENIENTEFGIYEPVFDFDTSESFKEAIKDVRDNQSELKKDGLAIVGGDNWTVNGSVVEGRKMTKRQSKLMLRAFNGECTGFISSVKWNNINQYEQRIMKSHTDVNKSGETHGIIITDGYRDLKIKELKLTHEYRLKKYEEKEEQKRIASEMREEEKARREYVTAIKEAEKEEKILQKAMTKARNEIEKATAEQRELLEKQLSELQNKLIEAEKKNKRAVSMAQQTKSGHVYIISNLGSFGERVYKIGMTRRLEPLDRVHELGDASVPFKFDVHAMIHSENAPELENKLHKHFNNKKMNLVNTRREYFEISLDEIEQAVKELHGEVEFIKDHEAREYRESLILRKQFETDNTNVKQEDKYPSSEELFN